jgi:ring-1,2-phenylacetyl-CoA epoxidase subunit PaaE
MIHFHPLRIQKVQRETEDCVVLGFEVPDHLKETFRFIQGQNLTFRAFFDGQEVRRNYSICSAPYENTLQVAVKKVEGGLFSTFANEQLKAGDQLEVMPPTGTFNTALDPSHQKHYVAFAAGSGITPIISIIKTTLCAEPHSRFTLVYGNKSKNSIIFKEELEMIKDQHMDRFTLHHILSREASDTVLNSGRIDVDKLNLLFSKVMPLEGCDTFFICGPEGMIFCVRDYLLGKGVLPQHIHFELFTVPGQEKAAGTHQQQGGVSTPAAKVRVKLDGITFQFDLPFEGPSVLDAALEQGADLPYACKGGVCTTCKALLREGEVHMDVNWGLEPEEVEKGFILTCQSHPTTPFLLVDFDAR